jgi:hypothetical protein
MANVAVAQAFITASGSGEAETALGQLHDDVQLTERASLPIAGEAVFAGLINGAKVIGAGEMAVARLDLRGTAPSTAASVRPLW